MSRYSCCGIRMVGAESGMNNVETWIHPALVQASGAVKVWGIYFLGTLLASLVSAKRCLITTEDCF